MLVISVFLIAAFAPVAVQAQTYRFEVSEYEVEAYIEADGSLTLYYYMVFQNDPNASGFTRKRLYGYDQVPILWSTAFC